MTTSRDSGAVLTTAQVSTMRNGRNVVAEETRVGNLKDRVVREHLDARVRPELWHTFVFFLHGVRTRSFLAVRAHSLTRSWLGSGYRPSKHEHPPRDRGGPSRGTNG